MVMRQRKDACSQRHYRRATTLFHVSGDTSSSSYIFGRAVQRLVRGSVTPRCFSPPGSSSAGPVLATIPSGFSVTTLRFVISSPSNDSSMLGCALFTLAFSSKVSPSALPLRMSTAIVLASVDLASVNRRRRRCCRSLARSFDRNPGPLLIYLMIRVKGRIVFLTKYCL